MEQGLDGILYLIMLMENLHQQGLIIGMVATHPNDGEWQLPARE